MVPWALGVLLLGLLSGLVEVEVEGHDGCENRRSWKCGQLCINHRAQCNCSGEVFNSRSGKHCCQDSCQGLGVFDNTTDMQWEGEKNKRTGFELIGAECLGQVLNLTEPCRGVCNHHKNSRNTGGVNRNHMPCSSNVANTNTSQCILEPLMNDGKYDCKNRFDENPFKKHSTNKSEFLDLNEKMINCTVESKGHELYDYNDGQEGFKCSGFPVNNNCLPLSLWCFDGEPFKCEELNALSVDDRVCSSQYFWEGRSCGMEGFHRCTGEKSGTCWGETEPCPDDTHKIKPPTQEEPDCGEKLSCEARDGKWAGETICLDEKYICDNTLQCAQGEDEAPARCRKEYIKKKTFTASESFPCPTPSLDTSGPGSQASQSFFPLRGIPCDRIPQCPKGEDESGCDLGSQAVLILGSAVAVLFVISLLSTSALGKIFARGSDQEEYSELILEPGVVLFKGGPEEEQSLMKDENFREIMMLAQELPRDDRRKQNRTFLKEISKDKGGLAEGLIWMKANIHPSTSRTLMEDNDYTGNCKERVTDTLSDCTDGTKAKCSSDRPESRWDFCSLMTRFRSVLFIYADILKDALIVMALLSILGIAFFLDYYNFSSLITWILLFSIIIPLAITAVGLLRRNPTIILGWKTWAKYEMSPPSWKELLAMRITVGFLWFVAPALIVNAQEEAKAKRRKLLKSVARNLLQSEDRTVSRTSLKQLSTINEFLKVAGKEILIFRKNELGLEIVIQLVVQLLMLLLSPTYTTHTATHSGLQAIFETDYTSTAKMASQYGVNIPIKLEDMTKGLLIISLLWSIKTAATTYIKIKTEEKMELFTIGSKSVLGVRSLQVYATRILCMLAFFGPSLGLLDCLAHWWAEQLNENPPEFTEWTAIGLGNALRVFIGLLVVQMVATTILKLALSEDFRAAFKKWSVSSILQHLVLTVNIPDNYTDWDQCEGNPTEHQRRMSRSNSENIAMIVVHNISNMLLLVPLWMTAANVWEKHQHVLDEGFAFPEEEEAASLLFTLSWVLPVIIAISALVDILLIFVYQKFFHPWRRILGSSQEPETKEPEVEMTSLVSPP